MRSSSRPQRKQFTSRIGFVWASSWFASLRKLLLQSFAYLLFINDGSLLLDIQPGGRGHFSRSQLLVSKVRLQILSCKHCCTITTSTGSSSSRLAPKESRHLTIQRKAATSPSTWPFIIHFEFIRSSEEIRCIGGRQHFAREGG